MKILVPVKQVSVLDDEFEMRDDGRGVDEDFFEKDLNEFDHFAVEEALLIKEAAGESMTTRPRRMPSSTSSRW